MVSQRSFLSASPVLTEQLSPTVPQTQGMHRFLADHFLGSQTSSNTCLSIFLPRSSPQPSKLPQTGPGKNQRKLFFSSLFSVAHIWYMGSNQVLFSLRNSSSNTAVLYHSSITAARQPQSGNLHISQTQMAISPKLWGTPCKRSIVAPFPRLEVRGGHLSAFPFRSEVVTDTSHSTLISNCFLGLLNLFFKSREGQSTKGRKTGSHNFLSSPA